jgi:hypothetical protein
MHEFAVPARAVHLLGDRRIRFMRLMIGWGFQTTLQRRGFNHEEGSSTGLSFSFAWQQEKKPDGFTAGRVGLLSLQPRFGAIGRHSERSARPRSIASADSEYGFSIPLLEMVDGVTGRKASQLEGLASAVVFNVRRLAGARDKVNRSASLA